jgi:hypothetical protein
MTCARLHYTLHLDKNDPLNNGRPFHGVFTSHPLSLFGDAKSQSGRRKFPRPRGCRAPVLLACLPALVRVHVGEPFNTRLGDERKC